MIHFKEMIIRNNSNKIDRIFSNASKIICIKRSMKYFNKWGRIVGVIIRLKEFFEREGVFKSLLFDYK